ncbi:hypothetical protein [Microbacterium aerolatum]|uniref:hypothetical protein n=1 Tax=Microbacterium aerolatum TaxID=153731 RepID=UPI00384BF103
MAELQAFSCNGITGRKIDQIPVAAFPYSRMLSAGDSGSSVTIPLDGTFSPSELDALTIPWARMIILERDGAVEYMGFPQGEGYADGSASTTFPLADWWTLAAHRGAWDHAAPNVERWSTTVNGNLATQASAAIIRGRDSGPALPAMGFPMTIPGFSGGASVSRTYFGYHIEMVGDILSDLMDEGLDIYMKPRWITNGEADWLMEAGMNWSSGVTREFSVTAQDSPVTGFKVDKDATRITNNARYVGEGSEVDMLVRSARNVASPYPLLDRTTQAKNITNVGQLNNLAVQDLTTYGAPTSQWSFSVTADTAVDVGDMVRLGFDGHSRVPDGWHTRRAVGIKGDLGEFKQVIVQPTGGA